MWPLAGVRETLATAGVVPVLTIVLVLDIVALSNGLGVPTPVCLAVAVWTCFLAPLVLGALPSLVSLVLSMRRGPVRIGIGSTLVATETVLPLATEVIILQVIVLFWARQLIPDLVRHAPFVYGLISLWWPLVLYALVVLYGYLPRTRRHLTLMDSEMTDPWQSRLLSAAWGMVVTAAALAAIALQAPIWALGSGALEWAPFFTSECVAAIIISLVIAAAVLTIPRAEEG